MMYYDEMRHDGAPDVTLMRTTRQRSRIKRDCDFCKHPIKPGDEYDRTFSVEDGVPHTTISHPSGSMCWESNEPQEDEHGF